MKKARIFLCFFECNELLNEKNNTKLVEIILVGNAIDGLGNA